MRLFTQIFKMASFTEGGDLTQRPLDHQVEVKKAES